MKKKILRNVAIVSAIFIVTLAIMLATNYFQVRGKTPLQSEVVELLKQLNDRNSGNVELQEQIRQLDLMARRAHFIRSDHMMTGVYILFGMLVIFIVCIRLYYAEHKNIPDKDIDPIDEWAVKSQARRYVLWSATGVAVAALVFALLSLPLLKSEKEEAQSLMALDEEIIFEFEEAGVYIAEQNLSEADANEDADESEDTTGGVVAVSNVSYNAFRGNNSNGISSARNLPVKWDLAAGTNIAWKRDVPRGGMSSPVINGNRIFFTGADAEVRELYCYDLITGEKLWTLAATDIPGSPARVPELYYDGILAGSTVAVNGNQVCAIFATGDLICADMNGNRLWAKNLGVPDNHYGYASSLLIFGNSLIVQYDNRNDPRVMALDLTTGAERWSRNRTERSLNWGSPSIANVNNTPVLILIGCPGVTAYNPVNGQQLWRVEALSSEPAASPASANGIVFVATEYSKLTAINAADGTVLWDNIEVLPDTSSPVATADNVYVADPYGMFVAFDAKTGVMRAEHELGIGFYSSPVIADGKIYLINREGKVHIFTSDNSFRLIESFETGEGVYATPAFTDCRIVIRTEKSIYCVAAN